jgi:mono/diheme cytochrome c family protein
MTAEIAEGQTTAEQFNQACAGCHPDGGNVFKPHLPLKKAPQLGDFSTFLGYIRDPKARDGSASIMPPFSAENFSDQQLRAIYQEIIRLRERD